MKVSRPLSVCIGFAVLLGVFWVGFRHSPLPSVLGSLFPRAFASFALLLAPLWFAGFGAAEPVRRLPGGAKILGAASLALPYVVFALGTPLFDWRVLLIETAFPTLLAVLLRTSPFGAYMSWRDLAALALITAAYFLRWFELAWPFAELRLLQKLFLADVALYGFLVMRELRGMGYGLLPSWSAVKVGMREWVWYFPWALILGEVTGFLHFHARLPAPRAVVGTAIFTWFLIALPEELFFRAIVQNLLESRLGKTGALIAASILFGLSHFNHGAAFNGRYVVLAAIAGIFYGRAWRTNRAIVDSTFTHTSVDLLWSLWFR